MTDFLVALVLLAILAGLIVLAARSWAHRRKEQESQLAEPSERLAGFAPEVSAEGFYVATVKAGEPLNRINAYGLGIRGKARISASKQGMVIERIGERNLAIDSADILNLQLVSGAIDRVVEAGGLIAITWAIGQEKLETTIRIVDESQRGELIAALKLVVSEGSK